MTSHRRVEKERADLILTYRILHIMDIEDKEKLLGDEVHNLVAYSQILFADGCIYVVWYVEIKWAAAWQNQQNDLCAQQRLRSAWASAQSFQSIRCPHEENLGP